MHILGKILTWMVFLGASAGTVLMSRNLQIKNSYTKKLEALKKRNIADAETIKGKEAELRGLDAEFEREMHEQQAYWDNRPGTPDVASGAISVGIGTQHGIGVVVNTTQPAGKVQRRTNLFVFYRPNGNAPQTKYVGEFVLGPGLGAQNCTVNPTWKLRNDIPDDSPGNWPNGLNMYRIRAAIPTKYSTAFRSLYLKLETVDRNKAAADTEKTQGESLLVSADAEVKRYLVIISGNDGASGMLGQLSKAEEDRDSVLSAVDLLRRSLKKVIDTRKDLDKRNRALVKKLPQPTSGSGKKP